MGIKELTQVIETHAPSAIENISLNSLRGKVIAVDAHIVLYQFLSVGQKDRVTLLLGLFHRVANLLGLGIKLVFVFDGQPPAIKQNELMRRAEQYAPTVSTAHIKDSQALLDMIGVPYIVAPAEAEAQCVHLVKLGVCDAVASEDLDTLPYGGEILLRHLKEPGQTQPTQINLSKVLQQMNLKMSSFVDLCILLGCDFVDKIPSVGKVKALSLLKEYGSIENILSNTHYSELVDRDWIECVQKARNEFIRPCVQDQARPPWGAVKKEQLLQHLCGELGASVEQIKKKLTLISTHGIENVAAVFLEQNLFADYTRFYKPEMKEIFESFMENYPIALRFPFNEFAQHCQSRRLLHIQRSDLVFKPRYIKKQLGLYRVYAVSAGVFLGRESFYACDICEKGFPSRNACKSHNTSSDHLQQVKRLVHKLGGKKYKTYFCSQLHCDQSFDSVTKYTHHLTHEKWLRVEMIPPPVLTPQDHSDDVETGFWCEDCNVQTTCAVSMAQHKKGKRHKRNVLKNLYLSHRDVLRETRANVKIYCEQEDQNVVTLAYERGRSQKITLVVKNESQEVDLELLTAHSINTWVNVTISLGSPVRIKPSDKKAVELTVRPQHYGRSELAVLFVVCQGGTSFLVSKEVTLKCVSNSAIFHQLKPSEPYQKIKRKKAASCDIIHSDSKPDIETSYALERTIELADYFIPPLVKKLLFQFTFSAGKAADGYESIM
ncbi:uncharacterized protein [Watersipora subatra]|uniref:uncharacterized protein n=1 Tax=Watersipora subatra TaxID=2589382 RepID=UPI00355BDC2F